MFASAQLYNSSLLCTQAVPPLARALRQRFQPKKRARSAVPAENVTTRRTVRHRSTQAVASGSRMLLSWVRFRIYGKCCAWTVAQKSTLILALRTLNGALARSPGNSSPCTGVATQYAALPVPRCYSQPPAPEPKLCALPAPVSPTEDATKQPSCGADAFGRASEAWIC